MLFIPLNFVRIAVDRLGGPTKAAHAAGVSNTTIHTWLQKRTIRNIDKARLVAQLTDLQVVQLRGTV